MKTRKWTMGLLVAAMALVLCLPAASQANPQPPFPKNYADTFWGGQYILSGPPTYKNTIGPGYDINNIQMTQNGNWWEITMTGPYFNKGGAWGSEGPGDLYLTVGGWSAETPPDYVDETTNPWTTHKNVYPDDKFVYAEPWAYVVGGFDPTKNAGQTQAVSLYSLQRDPTSQTFPGVVMTNAPANYIYRANQAWQGGYGNALAGAEVVYQTYSTGTQQGFITFRFPKTFAFDGIHWTMECGNNVIEIPVVSEPGILLLLGTGMLGLALVGRKTRRQRA